MHQRILRASALLALSFLLPAATAFPDKPLRLIVPFPAGGPTDTMARVVAQKVSADLGQPIVIENVGGAGGTLAAAAAARAAPDGYSLFFGTTGTIAINPALYRTLPYDHDRAFTPVYLVASSANVLLVHPSLPANNVRELIAYAKANPGKVTFGSAGNGSSNHLSGELLKSMTGVDLVHAPYKGTAPATNDLLGGRLSMMFDTVISGMPHVKAGKLRVLGITAPTRSAAAPEVPTIAEAGVPGFDVTIWFGILAPAATPKDVVAKLARHIGDAVRSPELRERFAAMGADPVASGPDHFAAVIRADTAKWAKVVKASGATVD